MARVDFYILKDQSASKVYPFACRLIDKTYQLGLKIYIHSANQPDADKLDNLLWTFNDISFIPHKIIHTLEEIAVVISLTPPPENFTGLLINLTQDTHENYPPCARIVEIVPTEEPWRTNGRKKFAYYRDHNHEIKTHEISATFSA